MIQILTKPAVSAQETERAVQELLNEFYKSYFDGASHDTGLGPRVFPVVDLFFNQTELPSPSERAQVHTVFTDVRPEECWTDKDKKKVRSESLFTIYVRAANQGADANETDFLCRTVADLVKEIFQAQNRYALAQKGIRRPRILRGPIALQSQGFQARIMILRGEVYYNIPRPERSDQA